MSTVAQLITDAFRLLGHTPALSAITGDESADALRVLNDLIETWNLDNVKSYTITRSVFALTPATQDYTLGSGGALDMARPVRIENASILLTSQTPNIEIPITILQDEGWQGVTVKTVTSSFPTAVYPNGGFPLNTLSFWPVPSAACSVVLYTWGQIQPFATVTDSVTFPNGYRRALRYNLAVDLAPEYGLEPSPTVQRIAAESLEWIRKQNWTPGFIEVDGALTGNRSSIGIKSRGYVVD